MKKAKNRDEISSCFEEAHKHNVLPDTREIFLTGSLDHEHDNGVDFKMHISFLKNLRVLEGLSDSPIVVHQHSIGGGWDEGMGIYDAIKNSDCYIIIVCHGIAASMGSIILQAADLRLSMPNCSFLIHEGYPCINIDLPHKQVMSAWNREEKLMQKMIDIYAERFKNAERFKGQTEEKVKDFIKNKLDSKADWWFDAVDSLNYGVIDDVIGSDKHPSILSLQDYMP